MVKNVSIKTHTQKVDATELKLKGNSEIVGGQVSFHFDFFYSKQYLYYAFFAINCVGYFTVKSLTATTTHRLAASESLGTKAKGINYRKCEFPKQLFVGDLFL